MPRIRLDLKYNGKNFYGWAKQPNLRTIQEELEFALSKVIPDSWGQPIPTIVGGRTDTGVHASGQVVHFDIVDEQFKKIVLDEFSSQSYSFLQNKRKLNKFIYRLNSVLPADIIIFDAKKTNSEFSARFWAKRRVYKYRIADSITYINPFRDDILDKTLKYS